MPKEKIHPRSHGDSAHPAFSAEVRWSGGQDMQLGVVSAEDFHLVDAIYADEEPGIGGAVARWAFNQGAFLGFVVDPLGEQSSDDVLIGFIDPHVKNSYVNGDKVLRYRWDEDVPETALRVHMSRRDAQLHGRMVLDIITGSTPFGGSVWVDLDRYGANRIIEVMRRARNSVFGKDA